MQVSVETTTGLERRMTVEVPASEVESAVMARLQEAAKTVRINGFRKGKIPLKVIRNRYGKGVRQEVVGEVMSKSYYEALNQQQLRPAGQPRIEPKTMEEGKDLEFTAVFEVYPEVELSDFSQVRVEKLVADVGEEDIDKMIETLRQQQQGWKEVKRQAQKGDTVNIDFEGSIDGEVFEGGSAQGTDIVLGSGRMIPGFEEGLLTKKAGDEAELDLTFPEDYQNKDLAGKEVRFKVKVNKVSEPELPELNDEFFARFGVTEGGEKAFREEVAANMDRELKNAARTKLKNQVMEKLLADNEVVMPAALVSGEIETLRQQAMQQFGGGNNIDPKMLPDELFREQAEKRVALGLIMGEVIKRDKIKADPVKVREKVEEIASTYESPEQVVNWYYGNEEQLSAVESAVLEDQVFDIILDQAEVSERKADYEEVIRQEQPEQKESPDEDSSGEEGAENKAEEGEKDSSATEKKPAANKKAPAKSTAKSTKKAATKDSDASAKDDKAAGQTAKKATKKAKTEADGK